MAIQRLTAVLVVGSLGLLTGCPLVTDPEDGPRNTPGPGDKTNPGTPVPAELTGSWRTILTYVPGYYTGVVPVDNFTGSLGISYYFSPDGQYEYNLDSAMAYFNGLCFRTTGWTESGSLRIDGSGFTLKPTRAINSIWDTCGESAYIDPAPAETVTLTVTRDQDQTGWPMLRLRLPSGEELLLEKCRDCK
jgi:hypothetical protein